MLDAADDSNTKVTPTPFEEEHVDVYAPFLMRSSSEPERWGAV